MTLCEEDCNLVQYNFTKKRVICSCKIKVVLSNIKDIKFDKKKLYKSFIDIKNIANINLMKCYKKVFTNDNLRNNYGFFIYIFIFALYTICLILFSCKYYSKLLNKINKLAKLKEEQFKKNKINNFEITNNEIISVKNKKKQKKLNKKINNGNPPKKYKRSKKYKIKGEFNLESKNSLYKIQSYYKNNTKMDLENKKILKFTDNELNSLSYKEALIYDNRTYFQYYISLLKDNHLLIFSFYINNQDYNSQIIKMFLFFFFFAVHFAVNALFFNDDTMHKIYIEEGKFNFIYQIIIILYSSLISEPINAIVKYLASSGNIILEIKNIKQFIHLKKKLKDIKNKIKIKFILFFMISFLLLIVFMFYISCFCGVYVNTQIHLIKDTIISFLLSLIYPFGIFLIPGIFRLSSLRTKDKNNQCLYKFSNFLENLPI